jgi:hypothetical protein
VSTSIRATRSPLSTKTPAESWAKLYCSDNDREATGHAFQFSSLGLGTDDTVADVLQLATGGTTTSNQAVKGNEKITRALVHQEQQRCATAVQGPDSWQNLGRKRKKISKPVGSWAIVTNLFRLSQR